MPTPAPLAAPVIIQVENLNGARPQSGISDAELVYEYETEGGISRFSSFFFHTPSSQVGPVRSARLVTIKLDKTYNGTLMYSGASQYVNQQLAANGVRFYSEGSGALFRITSRYAPHNLYTDTTHVQGLLNQVNPPVAGYSLWDRTTIAALPPGGAAAARVTVPVSASEQPIFTYDPASGTYTRTEQDTGTFVDAATGNPWHIGTVVVLHVPIVLGPEEEDVSGTHGLDHTIAGNGPAEVFVGGQWYGATFHQGPSGPPALTLLNGVPAPIAGGPVLIVLTRVGADPRIG